MEEGTTIRKHGSILLESILGENPSLVSIPFLSRVRFNDPVRMKGKRREEILKRTTSGFSGPALKRGANGKLDSRLSDDINLRNRKRGSRLAESRPRM